MAINENSPGQNREVRQSTDLSQNRDPGQTKDISEKPKMSENNESKWWQDASGVWHLTESNSNGGAGANESPVAGQSYTNSGWSQEDLEKYRNENFSYYDQNYLNQQYGIDPVSFSKPPPKNSFIGQIYKTGGNHSKTNYAPAYNQFHGQQYNNSNYQNTSKKRGGKIIVFATLIPIMTIALIISLLVFVVVPKINHLVQQASNYEYLGNTGIPNNGTYPPNSTTPNSGQTPITITNFNSVLNPQIEQSVINNVWTPFTEAVLSRNVAELSNYAIPSAVDIVVGALSCGCQPWPLAYDQIAFTAPIQSTYPIYFLAQMLGKDYDGNNETRFAIFSQNSPTSVWMIDTVSIYSGPKPPIGSYSSATTNIVESVPTMANTLLSPIPQQFANWLQTVDTSSAILATVPPLPTNFLTSPGITNIVQQKNEAIQYALTHFEKDISQTHTLDFVSPVFDIGNQYYLICSNIEYNNSLVTTNGKSLVQPTDMSQYGNQLLPGTYSAIKYFYNHSDCYMSTLNQAWWWTDYGGIYAMVGVP